MATDAQGEASDVRGQGPSQGGGARANADAAAAGARASGECGPSGRGADGADMRAGVPDGCGARATSGVRGGARQGGDAPSPRVPAAFARPENEDDDGYDPWSDRPPRAEPLFERDPWD